jgi:hypothetical protein
MFVMVVYLLFVLYHYTLKKALGSIIIQGASKPDIQQSDHIVEQLIKENWIFVLKYS